jgi:pimeloyl-ACP methyl ester carboxylesterase
VTGQAGRRATLAALASAGLAGCGSWWRPTPINMELLFDDRACRHQAPVLLVLLPGAHMSPAEMQREGMVQAVRQQGIAADVLIAGAGLAYIYDRSMFDRLHADVIEPYGARGYKRIWLAGISLGGFVAMGYAAQRPGRIEGILALAPYLGRRDLLLALQRAGSAQAWAAASAPRGDEPEDDLWRWLAQRPAGMPELHLGYGREDRFEPAHRLMAGLLPPERVRVVPGGHDWPPWRQLWAQWLARSPLPRVCPA